jgi:hypothetical protein
VAVKDGGAELKVRAYLLTADQGKRFSGRNISNTH